MGSRTPTSLGSSPGSTSPYRLAIKQITCNGGSLEALVSSSPPKSMKVLRLPKDPIQPSRGSVSDLHAATSSSDVEDEEIDFFNLDSPFRPRASTCPEALANQRRTKVRNMNRPPTPPPSDSPLDKLMAKVMIKEKLKIKPHSLPGLPEASGLGDIDTSALSTDCDAFNES